MHTIVRQCARCGHFDAQRRWASLDEAAARGATEQGWACPRCGWAEFTLVEEPGEPREAAANVGPGHVPSSALEPVDPDEARRRVREVLPFR